MRCKRCGEGLDFSAASCPACGAEVEFGRLTGILGIVCRSCDAYNDPGARVCAGCGKPLGAAVEEPAPPTPASAAPLPPAPAAILAPPAPPATPRPTPAPPPGPAIRSFPKGGAAATRFVPAVVIPPAPAHASVPTPVPTATRCPRCGIEAGVGAFCAHCGQALAQRGTLMMTPPPARAEPQGNRVPGPARPKLVLERGTGPEGATFRLEAEAVEAGRSRGAVVFPDDPCLAPHHATFLYRAGALHVRDEGAPGGTYLKLRGISVALRPGDHFAVGERLLRFAGPLTPAPSQPPDGTRLLGAPRPIGAAIVLEECLEGGATGRVFVRGGPSVTIGRAGCAVNLGEDPLLSQAHAEVVVDAGGGARLRDLGSSFGTFVRIPPHGERELREGDAVRIGREVLRVAASD